MGARRIRAWPASALLLAVVLACAGTACAAAGRVRVELDSDGDGGGSSDVQLQKMQAEAAKQLVEARLRRYKALQHRVVAINLAESAEEDKTKAELLKKQSALADEDAAFGRAKKRLDRARKRLKALRDKKKALAQRHDDDSAKADKAKENVMNLESKAGDLQEKAEEEATKIKAVKQAAAQEKISIPRLVREARVAEESALHLKHDARARMEASKRKTEEAFRLDRVAQEKEREAKMIRSRLVAILEERTKMLDEKERDASKEKLLASKGAKEAAAEAQRLAAQAAARAKLAVKAGHQAQSLMESEARAKQMVRAEQVNVKQQAGLVADAKQAYDHAKNSLHGAAHKMGDEGEGDRDREEDAAVGELQHEDVVMNHRVIEARRKANMYDAARHSAELHGAGERVSREGHDAISNVLHHREKRWMEQPVGAAKHLPFHAEAGSKGWIRSTVHQEQKLAGTESSRDKTREMLDAGAKGVRAEEARRMREEERRRGDVEEEGGRADGRERYDDGHGRGRYGRDEVGEDDEGHLVVKHRSRGGPLDNHLKEDGHYSVQEENFKKALAAAYRSGYEGMDAAGAPGPPGTGGDVRDVAVDGYPDREADQGGGDGSGREGGEGGRGRGRGERRDDGGEQGWQRGGRRGVESEREEGRGREVSGGERRERDDRDDEGREERGREEGEEREREGDEGGGEDREEDARRDQDRVRGGINVPTDDYRRQAEAQRKAKMAHDLARDTGRGVAQRLHDTLQGLGKAVPSDKPPEPPHYKKSDAWSHFWGGA